MVVRGAGQLGGAGLVSQSPWRSWCHLSTGEVMKAGTEPVGEGFGQSDQERGQCRLRGDCGDLGDGMELDIQLRTTFWWRRGLGVPELAKAWHLPVALQNA